MQEIVCGAHRLEKGLSRRVSETSIPAYPDVALGYRGHDQRG